LVSAGKISAMENLKILAARCHRLGRNNANDTGVNAITEEFYDEEYNVAKGIQEWKDPNAEPPTLYGVPICIKDIIALKGSLHTAGVACRTAEHLRCTQDCVAVQVLRSAGALPMVKSNVPQLLMLPETYNNVWGRTRNPWNLKRIPGGSSGGDAALVAMKCVPMALGSDIGGSIRIPAAFCGIVGFKPTMFRISGKGSLVPRKDGKFGNGIIITASYGPIARTVDDCALMMKAICAPKLFDLDKNVPPLLFSQQTYEEKKKLKIGYYVSDGWFEPCATAKRAVAETVSALTKAGHECVPFEPPTNGWDTYPLFVAINAADGNFKCYEDALEGEDPIDLYKIIRNAANIPNFLRPIIQMALDKRRSKLVGECRSGGLSVRKYWEKLAELSDSRKKWEASFQSTGLDAVIHPGLATPAMQHGLSGEFTAPFSYTFLANMLGWPAGVVPVTTVRDNEQHYRLEDIPENQRDPIAKIAAKVMEGSKGLPMSVAVMTPSYRDEVCLRVMKEIESVVNFAEEPQAYKEQ